MSKKEEQTESEGKPSKGRNNIMIIAGVVVLSAAIVGGGLFFGLKSQSHPAAAEASTDKKAEHAKKKEAPAMYPLEAFVVNIGDGHDMRYLKVKVELESELSTENAKKEMDPYLPPLRDAILVMLTTKTVQDVQDLAGKNKLREEILAAAKKVMASGKISNVYFTDFVVQ